MNDKTEIGQTCLSLINGSNTTMFNQNETDVYHTIRSLCENLMLNKSIKQKSDHLVLNLIKYFYPIILVVGLLGNFITFLTMLRIYTRRKNFQKFCLSLAILALADLFVLIIGCLREFLELILNFNIRSSSVYSCKLTLFTCYLFSCFSVYLHAFIAIERWHAISDPLKSKAKFSFKTNKIIIFLIFLTCIIINLPLLWFPTLKQMIQFDPLDPLGVNSVEECDVSDDFILILIDSVFYCLIPFIITILFSALTVFKLIQSRTSMNKSNETELLRQTSLRDRSSFKRQQTTLSTIRFKSSLNYHAKRNSFHSVVYTSGAPNEGVSTNNESNNRVQLYKIFSSSSKASSSSSNLKITVMLMALPISYLITTFPIFVTIIYGAVIRRFSNLSKGENSTSGFDTAYAIAKIFMYVNNSINILIYIFFGKSLRNDFIAILPFKNILNKLKTSTVEKNSFNQNDLSNIYNKSPNSNANRKCNNFYN